MASGEHHAPRVHREEIEAVDVDVNVGKKFVDRFRRHASRKYLDIRAGIDVVRHARKRLSLGLPDRRHHRASLAVEVLDLELVEVSDVESLHAEPGERQQVSAAHPSQPCDGHTGAANDGLFVG